MNTKDRLTFNVAHRDTSADQATLAARLESYRDKLPEHSTALIFPPASSHSGANQPNTALGIPEIAAPAFSADALSSALTTSGSLIVRGLFDRETATTLLNTVEDVVDVCEHNADKTVASVHPTLSSLFNPPPNLADIMPRGERELGNTRTFHRESGSAMCIEAASVAEALLHWYEQLNLKRIVEDYLGEPPCLSAKKWVLRRSRLPVAEAGWHQDGAFMGTDINSINMWLPLNSCGGNSGAPGLDVIPRRLQSIASAEGAQFDWSVSASEANATGNGSVVSPEFDAGDAFFFDHFFLHRTQYGRAFTRPRYAIETWFFGSSRFPKNQIPLEW